MVRALAIQKLDPLKAWCPRRWTKPNAMRNRDDCANAVERTNTKSLDANDKLIQTRSHVRDNSYIFHEADILVLFNFAINFVDWLYFCQKYNQFSAKSAAFIIKRRSKSRFGNLFILLPRLKVAQESQTSCETLLNNNFPIMIHLTTFNFNSTSVMLLLKFSVSIFLSVLL